MSRIAILDIDGTLVDTNYYHAIAWYRACREQDLTPPVWQIHRRIGMGGDQLVGSLLGEDVERRLGDTLRTREGELYMELIDEVRPFEGARALIEDLKGAGYRVVLGSSAKAAEAEHYLDLLDVRDLVDAWTTSADVEATKPEPDIVHASIDKVGGDGDAVMVGDSTWDCRAAANAGVPTVAVLTGGFSEQELLDAGASRVYQSVEELRRDVANLPTAVRA